MTVRDFMGVEGNTESSSVESEESKGNKDEEGGGLNPDEVVVPTTNPDEIEETADEAAGHSLSVEQ